MNNRKQLILAINPGGTSTKIGLYEGMKEKVKRNIVHDEDAIKNPEDLRIQIPRRIKIVKNFLKENNINIADLDAIVSRSGELRPMPSGAYSINQSMIDDMLSCKYGLHPCNLGASIAIELSKGSKAVTLIVDAPTSDEFHPLARLSGLPEIPRRSCLHVLNQRSIGKRLAKDLGKEYEDLNLIGVHMGGGISVAVHNEGKLIDANNGLDGDGPYSIQRAGSLPVADLINLCFSRKFSHEELYSLITTGGGLKGYLKTQDAIEVEKRILNGDINAHLVYEGLGYQVAKEIGAMTTVLKGKVDAIFFTGGLSYSEMLVNWIRERVDFLAPIYVYPGEDEIGALVESTIAVLEGRQPLLKYIPED